uniref:Uncharacterized protein n=1 Tax=Hyaloperonospora arabidopsidis (strain Emoy2) TaxID=559515 RepID=M4BI86_HYAAE
MPWMVLSAMVGDNLRLLTLFTSNGSRMRIHGRSPMFTRSYWHSLSVLRAESRLQLAFDLQFGEIITEFPFKTYISLISACS